MTFLLMKQGCGSAYEDINLKVSGMRLDAN